MNTDTPADSDGLDVLLMQVQGVTPSIDSANAWEYRRKALAKLRAIIAEKERVARLQGAVQALENMAVIFDKQNAREAKQVAKALRKYGEQLCTEHIQQLKDAADGPGETV